jgi:U3 small nucleolar RNA-associated protein 7
MTQNPHNAIIHLGHSNGTVTLWSPNMSTPLVKMFTHHGPVRSLAIDREGRYMVSAGADYRVRIWDVRKYQEVHSYYTQRPAEEVTISELGLLGIGWGSGHVSVRSLMTSLTVDMERCTSNETALSVHDTPYPFFNSFLSSVLSL